MTAVRRFGFAALVFVSWLSATVMPPPATTLALYSRSANGSVNTLGGAVFSPLSINAPALSTVNDVPRLTWTGVSLTSGYPVSYVVTRTASGGGTSAACPAASIVSLAGGLLQCDDTTAPGGDTYTYTVQPVLDKGGTITWTRPISPVSTQVTIPRLRFAGVGAPATFSNNSATVVSYPAGTTQGDLLIFVARNARNKNITAPTGWNVLVNKAAGNPASAFLVAWRVADAASSTTISINSSNDGAVAWITRYVRTTGVTATPVLATAASVIDESATITSSFGATAQLTTSQGYASVVTIASTILGVVPTLHTAAGFTSRVATTTTAATNSFAFVLADQLAAASGAQLSSPVWASATSTDTWQVITVAFA